MLRPGGADDVTAGEVYANGIALDVVRGWLGATASDLDWDMFNDADDGDAAEARAAGIGREVSQPREGVVAGGRLAEAGGRHREVLEATANG